MTGRTLRVLVVEDEMTIALLMEDMLIELGHEVIDLAMRLPQALELAKVADFDLAILDVNLDGRMSFPVAEALDHRGLPYIFVTGYGSAGVDPLYRKNSIILPKPFDLADLRASIERLGQTSGGGAAGG
jgi:DNA-binding response OmpR family regulator